MRGQKDSQIRVPNTSEQQPPKTRDLHPTFLIASSTWALKSSIFCSSASLASFNFRSHFSCPAIDLFFTG
jgi:hypothetical protein